MRVSSPTGGLEVLIRILILVSLLVPCLAAEEAPAGFAERLTLVESTDAPGHIDQNRLSRVFWQLIREQKLQLKRLPRVLVLHVSRKVASNVGLAASTVRTDHCTKGSDDGYYQLWLVGEPAMPDYVTGLETVLQHEFDLQPPPEELKALLERVAKRDLATVDVRNLAGK